MKTFTTCAEKKAKQILNLLQGYTKGIRITAILILFLMGVSNAWAHTATFRCVPALTFGNNWKNGNSCKVKLKLGDDKGDATYDMHATGLMYEKSGNLYEIYEGTASDLPYDGAKNLHFERWEGSAWKENQGQYDDWRNCTAWSGSMHYGEWGNYSYKSWNLPSNKYIYFEKPSEWTYAQFMVGHYSSSEGYVMTPLLNTKLYYVKTTQWDGYLQSAFIDANNKWGSESNSVGSRKLHADHSSDVFHYQELINTSNGYGLFTTNFKDDHSTVLSFSRGNSYSILNKSQTITLQSYNLASKTYTNSSTVGSVSFSSIKMSSATNTTNSSQTITNTASADAIYTANVTLTASVNPGYKFDCWSDGNNQLGTNLTYSYSVPSTNKTVYARFSEITYSVQVKSADNNQGTISPANVNAGQFTGVTITATPKIGYSFVNWTATNGITITNPNSASTTIKATKAGTVTANFKAQPSTTVYLKTTANWKDANARFAIYYWGANDQNGWVNMTEVDCNRDYFKGEIPYGSTGFNFVRMNPSALANNWDNNWDQTGDLSIPTNNNNCFTITNDHWGEQDPKATGTWAAYNPTVTLTLKSSSNGTYKITYEGKTHESSLTEDVVINDLPLNAEIIISDNANARPGYTFKKCLIKLGTNEQEDATLKTTYALCGTTTITADFVTEGPHTVYFKPNSNWTVNSARFAVYAYDEEGNEEWYDMTQSGAYYTCNIKSGLSNIIFVRMNPAHATNKFADGYSWNQTLSHAIPVNRFSTYILYDGKWGTESDEGYWTAAPTLSGSYRLRYVEQLVEHDATETWKVEVNETKACHAPDDVIQKRANGRDTISLFINVNGDNPEVILQQYDESKWVDIEAHMVNGPLEADAGMAMINGRRNASADSDIDNFVYDDGIDAITESGVWNFVIVQDAEGNASLLLKENDQDVTHKYTGNYYIRTNNATGGWNEYTHPDNIMKPSTNPESGYTHYYCKWVEIAQKPNVKFIVSTDYSINVSKECAKDDYTKDDGVLVENANVRWSWDENTGTVARAYIQGAYNPSNSQRLNNIVLDYTTDGTNNPDEVTLDDSGDWIYTIDVTVNSGATLDDLIAQYPSQKISEVSPQIQNFITGPLTILTGMSNEDYTVRVTYDFKNNKVTTFLLPGTTNVATAVDVMIERVNQDETKAVQSTIEAVNDQFTVCGVMSFTKAHLTKNALHNDLRQFYWISFPFDVNLEDVYGFGVYGKHWILETYNGERRAQDGLWLDSPSFWEYILDSKGVTLEANKGYLLCLDSELLSGTSDVFTNTNKVSLYFPAKDKTSIINTAYTTEVTIHEHICTIERANRNIYDSNWNLIGVPSYANHTQTTNTENLQYFYDYQYDNQTGKMIYAPKSITNSTNEFQSMYAYFVQWGGTLNWSTFTGNNSTPQELAAKRNTAYEVQEYNLRLELQQDYKALDQTFVDMQEDGVTAAFDLNKDMTKILNAGANIYTLAGEENIQLAGNSLPIANTTIPVGVQIAKAGEYTFAMPDGTAGITVELIDYETNTRTNLLFNDYTVNLPAGTNESRFALYMQPSKVATDMENISDETTGLKKYIIDGQLFLQKDGMLYDAQGHIVR